MKFRKFIKESLSDMDKRCPECNNLLNDMGTCPYCDHGEEELNEAMYKGKEFNFYIKVLFSQRDNFENSRKIASQSMDNGVRVEENGYILKCYTDDLVLYHNNDELRFVKSIYEWEKQFAHLAPSMNNKQVPNYGVILNRKSIKQEYTDNELRTKALTNEQLEAIYDFATFISDGNLTKMIDLAKKSLSESSVKQNNNYIIESYASDWFVLKNTEGYYTENNKLKAFTNSDDAKLFLESLSKNSVNEDLSARAKLKAAYPELNFDAPVTEEVVKEDISNREKLLRAYPELNFDNPVVEEVVKEDLSNKEKLLRAFPELNFDNNTVTEEVVQEKMSIKDKLKAAYPELNFDERVDESVGPEDEDEFDDYDDFEDNFDNYDDSYDMDDIEQDYAHASLYGGDLTYCKDCGTRLTRTEWGSYCPLCDTEELDECNESLYSEECDYRAKETSYEIAYEIAQLAKKALKLPAHEVEMLEHDINNLRANEWVESFAKLSDSSKAKQLFFQNAVEPDCE